MELTTLEARGDDDVTYVYDDVTYVCGTYVYDDVKGIDNVRGKRLNVDRVAVKVATLLCHSGIVHTSTKKKKLLLRTLTGLQSRLQRSFVILGLYILLLK